jgi:transposase-like protein
MLQPFNNLFDLTETFPDEQSCIDYFTAVRWSDKEYCPHCKSNWVYHFANKKKHKCGYCRKKFSIRVGTIFEDSKIPLQKWFMAIHLATSDKKVTSSIRLSIDIDVTQKTAWFMLRRLNHSSQAKSFNTPAMVGLISPRKRNS